MLFSNYNILETIFVNEIYVYLFINNDYNYTCKIKLKLKIVKEDVRMTVYVLNLTFRNHTSEIGGVFGSIEKCKEALEKIKTSQEYLEGNIVGTYFTPFDVNDFSYIKEWL